MAEGRQELTVVVRAKDLCRYVMTVTQRSPKQFRFTFTGRLQNLSMDIITEIYLANEVFVGGEGAREAYFRRLTLQRQALTKTRLLAYLAELALEQKAILPKQYEQIALRTTEVVQLIGGWINSDRSRFRFR